MVEKEQELNSEFRSRIQIQRLEIYRNWLV